MVGRVAFTFDVRGSWQDGGLLVASHGVAMPFVRSHTRNGKPVKGYHRVNSVWNFWFGLILMIIFFAMVHKSR